MLYQIEILESYDGRSSQGTKVQSMASQVAEALEKHLECAICLERYDEPKVLSCMHSYCKKCLEKLVYEDKVGHHIPCPECRKETEVRKFKALYFSLKVNKKINIVSAKANPNMNYAPMKKCDHSK